ncbi:MAG TPA: extracellular solute-binding protein [Bacilli bacterium]
MKRSLSLTVSMILVLVLVLSACGKSPGNDNVSATTEPTAAPQETAAPEVKEVSGEVTIWTWDKSVLEPVVPAFNAKFPNVKINIQVVPDNMGSALTTIASGSGGPDIVAIEQGQVSRFNNILGIEDLYQAPYNVMEFKDDFITPQLDRYTSLDGKRLIAMPLDAPPATMYYRADILEAEGFPTDPVELAEFMKDETNVLNMAQSLKAKGKLFLPAMGLYVPDLVAGSAGYFDHSLNYIRNNDQYVKELDFDKKVAQLGLIQTKSMWAEDGQQAIESGETPIIFSASWLMIPSIFPAMHPTQKGLWKVTAPPFGVYSVLGGAGLALLSQSKNKEAAWEFLKFATASTEGWKTMIPLPSIPGYKPAWTLPEITDNVDPYTEQKSNQLFVDLLAKIPYFPYGTPLDAKANGIFTAAFADAIKNNTDSKAALNQIETDIMKAVAPDRDILLKSMGQ